MVTGYQTKKSGVMGLTDKKPKKDASHVLVGEREKTLASAVKRRASSIYSLDRAFEIAGCSCAPYRRQLEELEVQYQVERERLMQELDDSELAGGIKNLKATIADIDLREHSSLDAVARQAHPFFPVWMMDQVREGNADILGLSDRDIASSYAEEWYGGWRPRSLYKATKTEAPG